MPLPTIQRSFYECTLPSTQEVVNFRPYLIKEEREILRASKSDNQNETMNALKHLVNACVQKEGFDCFKIPSFDLEYLFLQIRSKSVGEVVEFNTKCEKCNHTIPVSVDISNIVPDMSNCPDKLIPLIDDISIQMRYPTMEDINNLPRNGEEDPEMIFKLSEILITTVWNGEQSFSVGKDFTAQEISGFLDQLKEDEFKKITDFIESIPAVEHTVSATCSKCGEKIEHTFRGMADFFG